MNTTPKPEKINWGTEFSKYIKRLRKTPKYRGFSYPCLVTQENIVAEFKKKKERYLAEQKRQEQILRQKLFQQQQQMKRQLLYKNQKNQKTKSRRQQRGGAKKQSRRYKGGGIFDSVQNSVQSFYNTTQGNPPLPNPAPYAQRSSSMN